MSQASSESIGNNIAKIRGLKRAAYILKLFTAGVSELQLGNEFGKEDGQMVRMWKLYLIGNHYMTNEHGVYTLTKKGKRWLQEKEEAEA